MLVWNLALLLLATIGFTAWVVAIVNRVHSLPLPGHVLDRIKLVHDLLILGFPLLLLVAVALPEHGLLRGGTWFDLSLPWKILFGFCSLGLLGTLGHILFHRYRRTPPAQLSIRTERFNVEQALGFRPAKRGAHSSLLHVPGNEVFQLEITHREFQLSGLPPACDGLRILHISDWHLSGVIDRPYYHFVTAKCREIPADLLVFTGDLLDDQSLVDWLPETLGTLSAPLGRYFILGNHDWYLRPEETRVAMRNLGWEDLAGRTRLIEHLGHRFLLGGTEFPWMGTLPEMRSEPADCKILLSHTPDNYPWARGQNVDLILAGHNHGGQIRIPGLGPVYSPSRFGCRYASGVFQDQGSLLFVSRGLGGVHPLRLNCLPEITCLTLRAKTP
ncbi:MAG: metallophosphoesterase [Planctomycetales bacterium]